MIHFRVTSNECNVFINVSIFSISKQTPKLKSTKQSFLSCESQKLIPKMHRISLMYKILCTDNLTFHIYFSEHHSWKESPRKQHNESWKYFDLATNFQSLPLQQHIDWISKTRKLILTNYHSNQNKSKERHPPRFDAIRSAVSPWPVSAALSRWDVK